jgi:hypothetical protein
LRSLTPGRRVREGDPELRFLAHDDEDPLAGLIALSNRQIAKVGVALAPAIRCQATVSCVLSERARTGAKPVDEGGRAWFYDLPKHSQKESPGYLPPAEYEQLGGAAMSFGGSMSQTSSWLYQPTAEAAARPPRGTQCGRPRVGQ